jgi:glyoxylase-like metal-dependent hydrolase (beta-lactamase superfamily II)
MHQQEKDWLERPLRPPSPGPPGVTAWGRILIGIVAMFMPLVHIPATDVDIVLGDEEMYLADYGIPGRVIHTPGHSSGSVSVLLDTGDVFVGDLAMNKFPLRFSPGLPIFAEDLQKKRAGNCYWIKAQKRSTRRMGSLFQLISFGKFWCKEAPAKAPHALRFAEDYDATYREGLP